MARGGHKRKHDTRGPLQKLHDAETVANDQSILSVITPEQRAKGTYSGDRRVVNNHDPVERWKAANRLTQPQQVAIELVQRLWRLTDVSRPLTACYGERMPGGGNAENREIIEIEAREDLHRIQDYVPRAYWSVFENCCRHGMPAGVAGGEADRNGAHRAYVVVCFVADVISMKERV